MTRCLQDSMRNILMCVTIFDPFASNLGIDEIWNRLDHPWIFIVPLRFFLYVESLLPNPIWCLLSYPDCIHIVIQQTQTAKSEVLHTTLPRRPLTLLQNPKSTEVSWKQGALPIGIPHSDIHIYALSATTSVWTYVTSTVATHQGPNSILRPNSARFVNTLTILCHAVSTRMLEQEALRLTIGGLICRGHHVQPNPQYSICPALRVS